MLIHRNTPHPAVNPGFKYLFNTISAHKDKQYAFSLDIFKVSFEMETQTLIHIPVLCELIPFKRGKKLLFFLNNSLIIIKCFILTR